MAGRVLQRQRGRALLRPVVRPPDRRRAAERVAGAVDAIAASGTAVVALIVAITLVRLLGAAGAIDPLAGPDTGSYLAAARGLADRGLLADHVPNLPYWPAGYPAFLAAIFAVVGDAPRAVAALQVLLLGVATWCLFTLVRREIGGAVAVVAVVLTGISPALLAASNELMYETVLASALVIAFDLASRARRAPGPRGVALAAAGAFVLGLAATMQPKALVVVIVLLAWVCAGPRDARATRARTTAWMALAVVLAAAVGPLALMARTAAATDHAALSANLGATARIGLNDGASGGYRYDVSVLRGCGLPARLVSRNRVGFSDADLFAFDRTLIRCSASWATSHPLHALRLAAVKALYFWSPMVGPLPRDREASWAQPFDLRRAVPLALRDAGALATANRLLGNLWTLLVAGLVLAGAAAGVRGEHRRATLLLAAPVALFLAVSMVTIGDARFRLPVAPLYAVLQALALVAVLHRLAGRTERTEPAAPQAR